MGEEESKFPTDRTDASIAAGAAIASLVPWLGGPVSSILSGYGQTRKLNRVKELLDSLAEDLRDFESEVAKEYVKTEDFEELLEQTLRRAADERQADVRNLYLRFLRRAITAPGDDYDDQLSVLRAIQRLRAPHIAILNALRKQPGPDAHRKYMGSPIGTLQERTRLDRATIGAAVALLNDLRLTDMRNLHVMMTGHGSENLGHMLTPFGVRVLTYICAV